MKEGVIVGYSGHAYVVIEVVLANNYSIKSYCEMEKKQLNPYELTYLGYENESATREYLSDKFVFIGIGDNTIRANLFNSLLCEKIKMPEARHPSAIVSGTVKVGDGSIIMPGVIINPLALIGKAVICNTSSVIEHEANIGDFSHIAPGAVIAGGVKIGKNCFIGANSVIKQGVQIGDNVVVGAGSVVLKNVSDNSLIYGNPAKRAALG